MRIVLVGPTPPYRGGIPRYTVHLYRALALRHTVRLVSYSRQYPRWLYPGPSDVNPDASIPVPGERILDQVSPFSWFAAAKSIAQFAPDAVVVQWWQSFGAPCMGMLTRLVSRRTEAPILAICHNLVAHERRGLDTRATRLGLGGTSALLVQSDEDLRTAREILPNKPVWRVNHPVWEDLSQLRVSSAEARSRLGLWSGSTLLFFGLVRPHKGLGDLLTAMPQVCRQVEARLLVVGEFWDNLAKYERLIASLGLGGRVRIVDRFVSDAEMALYFGASDLVVLPYRTATQSGVVATAYAFDRPVVTTSVGGLEDMVLDGISGHITPPSNPEALAASIVDCLQRGAPGSYVDGVARARSNLSWEALAERLEEVVVEVKGRS